MSNPYRKSPPAKLRKNKTLNFKVPNLVDISLICGKKSVTLIYNSSS